MSKAVNSLLSALTLLFVITTINCIPVTLPTLDENEFILARPDQTTTTHGFHDLKHDSKERQSHHYIKCLDSYAPKKIKFDEVFTTADLELISQFDQVITLLGDKFLMESFTILKYYRLTYPLKPITQLLDSISLSGFPDEFVDSYILHIIKNGGFDEVDECADFLSGFDENEHNSKQAHL
ncbi:unnamed protein product [Ambrosiozyma monospora]|uniref:Unnamed protein product n=1 Tax=Ambrosiozyma monospora TaxID=43982 RepID=A0ACB5U0H9_AMBMO|nr:unnamed protein product [Ambrosiozyma monospora]